MSFGISAGDFVTIGRLVNDIVSALRSSAVKEYNELILELHGLQYALQRIEQLRPDSAQTAEVNAIKVAALICHYPLEEFASKLRKFDVLDDQKHGHKRKEAFEKGKAKIKWTLTMEKEVQQLRAYLAAHVRSLNTRLLTQGL